MEKTTLLVLFNDLLIDLDATTISEQTSTSTINTGTSNSISLSHFNITIVCSSKYNKCFIYGSSARFVISLYYWVLNLAGEIIAWNSLFCVHMEMFIIRCMTNICWMLYRKSLREKFPKIDSSNREIIISYFLLNQNR